MKRKKSTRKRERLIDSAFRISPQTSISMDPLPLAIAGVPLAVYLLMLGAINLRRRPLVLNRSGRYRGVGGGASRSCVRRTLEFVLAASIGDSLWSLGLVDPDGVLRFVRAALYARRVDLGL